MSEYVNGDYELTKNAEEDTSSERKMNKFLMKNVYPEFIKMGLIEDIINIDDVELQKKGVDAIWKCTDGTEIIFDNKNRASTLNIRSAALPFEVRTNTRDGKIRYDGWFTKLSEEMFGTEIHKTDYILFTHPYSKNKEDTNFDKLPIDDIKGVDIIICRADEVHKYLKEYYKTSFKEIYKKTLAFDAEFMSKTDGLDSIPHTWRKCTDGFERGLRSRTYNGKSYETWDTLIHTSARSYMLEDPTNLLIREDVIKNLPHTRHFYYSIYKGLSENTDVKERRPFEKIEH